MISRKYTGDYRLENVTDKNGRVKTVTVYCGDLYVYKKDAKTVRSAAVFCCGMCLVSALMFIAMLCINVPAAHNPYVTLPVLFNVFPIWYMMQACWRIAGALKRPVSRQHKDKAGYRFNVSTLILIITAIASLIGMAVYVFAGMMTTLDILWLVCEIAILASALLAFSMRATFDMEMLSTDDANAAEEISEGE